MFRSYHFKWCFILIGILAGSTFVIRLGEVRLWGIGQVLGHILSITFLIFSCWLVHAFFRNLKLPIHNRARIIISITTAMVIALGIIYYYDQYLPPGLVPPREAMTGDTFADFLRRLMAGFYLSMICYIVFNIVYTNNILQKTQLENEHLKQAHLHAQLISLQQQISPHFLFNSLSTLKNIAADTDTKKFVVQLAHVYRYLLNYNEHHVTSLSEELSFIHSYLYILHQRFETALDVNIEVPDRYLDCLIPPLSLQLLLENAIKHNVLSPEAPLHIHLSVNSKGELEVVNNCRPKKVTTESTGLGLQNIKDRYQLLFNKDIRVNDTQETFTVSLPLISNERNHN
ncbi:sensor histidine kinase [Chitinophaga pinensis]|uniref:Signal transduction histidine kinase, LytS n=1 Tax=Chitinophaga pinensis (strain ATCC 43595 / DSM 2588 / LMG 13176 / NBRC 15968 / NCIMB 11800 / UQM 2034) TaxID=485918 RepID=A0A979GP12_CHIPD|nr:histidine kinase [Chitinophaga pinensis]ACU60142.1 signal transduction histidine kinase, LytS [Chitinophaga pinensis DSM 2588]